ncbi:MAG: hypothetical protein K5925_01425 [Bacilli bacterium]|nr:hypothetical protein [Bacilli bacterium]
MGKNLTKDKKSLLKIVAATSVAIFSLLSVCTGAFAWFLSVRDQSAASSSFSVKSYGKFSSLKFHTFEDSRTVSSIKYLDFNGGTPTGSITYDWERNACNNPVGNTNIVLDQYDPLNQSQPLLAIFELDREYNTSLDGSVMINAIASKNDFLGKTKNDGTTTYRLGVLNDPMLMHYDNGVYYYPLSSAATFKCRGFSEDEYEEWISSWTYSDDDYVSGFYSLADNSLTNSREKFVQITNEVPSFHQNINIYNSGEGHNIKYIAVVIDYDADAVEYIYSSFLGNHYLESTGYHLSFVCDWDWEII